MLCFGVKRWCTIHDVDVSSIKVDDVLTVVSVQKEPEYMKHVVNLKTGDTVFENVPMKIVRKMRKAFLPKVEKPLPPDIHDGNPDPEEEVFNVASDDF